MRTELVSRNLNEPMGMAFIGKDDFIVNEKNNGTVKRVINSVMLQEPLLDVNVNAEEARGMIGISVTKNIAIDKSKTFVFLYYTEAKEQDGGEPLGNRLYRYELDGNKLKQPKLRLDLPYQPTAHHNRGVIDIGADNNIYIAVGELTSTSYGKENYKFASENIKNGREPDGRGGILRTTQDGNVVCQTGILGDEDPLKFYYTYGIRNSFGLAFDPVTQNYGFRKWSQFW